MKKVKKIGKLAQARLSIKEAEMKLADAEHQYESLTAVAKAVEEDLFLDNSNEALGEKARAWRNASHAGSLFIQASNKHTEVFLDLMKIIEENRPGKPTVTATMKNRIPGLVPEMGLDWIEVQEQLTEKDETTRRNKVKNETECDTAFCRGCRQEKARHKAGQKPSKARK